MASSVEDVLDEILTRRIAKQDALESFKALPEAQRERMLASLRERLENSEPDPKPEQAQELRSLHEMNVGPAQLSCIDAWTEEYALRVPRSKDNAQRHQAYFVDQRKTAGLKRALKALQFQLTYERAEGAYIFDVDGNRYVDLTGDNGVNLFGHQPEFMKQALIERLHRGYPLVAYSEDLFEAARLFCELTGHERMVFTQSGTEALMWTVRIARAATGRKKLVILDGSYHGLSDAVLAFRDRKGGSMSAGLGMLQEFADQLIILDYGDLDQLQQIEAAADDIAAVLVEPIQSRFPSRQPLEYLRSLRTLTLEKGIVLVFDEMITGFRAGPRGAEGFFKVKPDLSTYGKVAGGGMPTGIIAGLAKYMDYVDGGTWRFDDASMPSLRRTMMAGTHTQNSLKVAATLAVCREMQRICDRGAACDGVSCACALGRISQQTTALADEVNAYFAEKRVPLLTEHFSSLFRFQVTDDPFGLTRELFFFLLRLQGIETSTSGNCFLTTAHTDADLREVIDAVKHSVNCMLEHGFFLAAEPTEVPTVTPTAPIQAEPTEAARAPTADPMQQLKQLILADLQVAGAGGR